MNSVPVLPRPKTEDVVIPRPPPNDKTLKQVLRSLHLKVTDQRMMILQTLHEGRAHMTAQEVFEAVKENDASLGFATVYRFLRKLVEAGHVTEVRMGGQPARYEMTPAFHHDHLTCTHCGRICEFENAEIENLQIRVAEYFGFELTGHVLELYGICTDCRKNKTQRHRRET